MITLNDCLDEIKNALNNWYPLQECGDSDKEVFARHVRLMGFKERLEAQIKQGEI